MALCSTVSVTSNVQTTKDKPGIFYSITGNGLKQDSYLFGTYHMVKESFLDRAPAVLAALKSANGVVVELIVDEKAMGKVAPMSMMKENTLTALLPAAAKDSLEAELRSAAGLGIAQFEQLKPVNVVLTLLMVQLMKSNSARFSQYSGQSMDAFFAASAKATNKKVTELETIEAQMHLMMNHYTETEQVNSLRAYLHNKAAMNKLGDELVDAWFAKDLDMIDEIYQCTLELSGEEDYMVKARNNNWMKTIPALIQQQSQFIAVGALHLAGEAGLVNQLRKLGFTVTCINF